MRAELWRHLSERVERLVFLGNLVRQRTSDGFAVSFDIPASALMVGEYELTLKGIAADHASQDLGYYYFGVQTR